MRRTGYLVVALLAALSAFVMVLPTSRSGIEIVMTDSFTFEPAEISVRVGSTVVFRNDSRVTHTATCADCPWGTGDVQPGLRKAVRLLTAGDFVFRCLYHAAERGMAGLVRVTASP